MKKNTQKGKYLKTWSSARRQSFKTAILQSSDSRSLVVFSTCTGLVGPRLLAKDMIKRMVVCSPMTMSKKIWSALLLTGTDVSTCDMKHYLSDEFGLGACKPARKPGLNPPWKLKEILAHLFWFITFLKKRYKRHIINHIFDNEA